MSKKKHRSFSLSVELQPAAYTQGRNFCVQPIVVYIESDTSDHS